jgi:hypothetical protein
MKSLVHYAVAGAIAAALMVLITLMLSQQPALLTYHYQRLDLSGQEGLRTLAVFVAYGAGYAVAYGLLLRALIPGGLILGSLTFAVVPTLVSALVLPMYHNLPAIRDPWVLGWGYFHWFCFALCLLFIAGSKGGGGKRGGGED